MNLFKREYRIVTDAYLGYEVQHRYPLWPFWSQTNFVNTHSTLEGAKRLITREQSRVVWTEGDDL